MAFSKKHKRVLLDQYEQWLQESNAVFMLEFSHMNMKAIDDLRAKTRDAGGRAHIVKNTILERALKNAGFDLEGDLVGTTLVGFSFGEAPELAKMFNDLTKASEIFKIKGGFLDKHPISGADVKALAELPPLPVMRARLLGMLQAPASQLVRTLAEPARQVAAVVKAYSEKEAAPA